MRYSPQNTKVLISSTCDVLSSFLREGEEFPYGALCVTTSFLQGSSQGTKKIRFTTCQETKNLCHTHSQIHGRYDDLPKTDISISDEAFNQLVKSRKFSFFLSSKWQIDEGIICHFTPLPCNYSHTKKRLSFHLGPQKWDMEWAMQTHNIKSSKICFILFYNFALWLNLGWQVPQDMTNDGKT